MDTKLIEELSKDTRMEDISQNYQNLAHMIGIENLVRLCEYTKGDMIYIPKTDTILAAARNRRIKKEYNGHNIKALCEKYDLTPRQMVNVIKDVPPSGQMDFLDIYPKEYLT